MPLAARVVRAPPQLPVRFGGAGVGLLTSRGCCATAEFATINTRTAARATIRNMKAGRPMSGGLGRSDSNALELEALRFGNSNANENDRECAHEAVDREGRDRAQI